MADENAGAAAGADGGAGAGTPPPTVTDWTTSLSAEHKGYVQNKQFKDPGALLESYINLEKVHGVPPERIIKIPESIDLSTPEGRSIFEKLGAPKAKENYNIKLEKDVADETFTNGFRDTAYKMGLTNKQAEGLAEFFNATGKTRTQTAKEQAQIQVSQAQTALKKDWGADYDKNVNLVNQTAKALEISPDEMTGLASKLGPDKSAKLLLKLAKATSEDSFVGGGNAGTLSVTPELALSKINSMIKDAAFGARLRDGDVDARNEWDRMNKLAYPGTTHL